MDTASLQGVFNSSSTSGLDVNQSKHSHTHLKAFGKKERITTVRHTHSKEMWRLSKGDYFGEDSLLIKERKIFYTVRCIENTELITIDADDFDETLRSHFQSIIDNRAQMLAGMELFQSCSPQVIHVLALLLRENQYKFGDCIYRQNMACKSLRMIEQGSVKISSDSKASPPRELVEKVHPPKDYLGEILMEDTPQQKDRMKRRYPHRGSQAPPTVSGGAETPGTAPSQFQKKKKSCMKPNILEVMGFVLHQPNPQGGNVYVCTLGRGDMLCDIEAICKLNRHLFSAVCVSDAIVYELKYALFEAVINKRLGVFTYQVIERVTQQVQLWRCGHIDIPFFDPLIEVMGQMKKELEAEGIHKIVGRIHHKCSTSGHSTLADRGMMDLPASAGSRKNGCVPLHLPSIDGSSIEESSDAHNLMPQLEVLLFSEHSDLGADLTYHPQLNKTSGTKAKKNIFSFDTIVPFGKINRIAGPPKPTSATNTMPLSTVSATDAVPSYLSSTSHEENSGVHSGNNISSTSLARIRYQVLYNKKQHQRNNDLYRVKRCPGVVYTAAFRRLHVLTAAPDSISCALISELENSEDSQAPDGPMKLGEVLTNPCLIANNDVAVAGDTRGGPINIPRHSCESEKKENDEVTEKENEEKQKGRTEFVDGEKRKGLGNSALICRYSSGEGRSSAGSMNTVLFDLGT